MLKISVISLLLVCSLSMKFKISLDYGEQNCFVQALTGHQKYSYETRTVEDGTYEMSIHRKNPDGSFDIVHKQETDKLKNITIHRLAAHEGSYYFCSKNLNRHKIRLDIVIQSGLQLLQFEILPNLSDAQNFERQLHMIQKETMKFVQNLDNMIAFKSSSWQIINIMPMKLISFSIIGILSIIVTQILFYRYLKQSLKERKFI